MATNLTRFIDEHRTNRHLHDASEANLTRAVSVQEDRFGERGWHLVGRSNAQNSDLGAKCEQRLRELRQRRVTSVCNHSEQAEGSRAALTENLSSGKLQSSPQRRGQPLGEQRRAQDPGHTVTDAVQSRFRVRNHDRSSIDWESNHDAECREARGKSGQVLHPPTQEIKEAIDETLKFECHLPEGQAREVVDIMCPRDLRQRDFNMPEGPRQEAESHHRRSRSKR